jgi:hypothetical protein
MEGDQDCRGEPWEGTVWPEVLGRPLLGGDPVLGTEG